MNPSRRKVLTFFSFVATTTTTTKKVPFIEEK
jgi:hypothetical protein